MQEILIEELAYWLKKAKENGQPQPIFFLGAGASKSGNIPLADEITSDFLSEHPDHPLVKKLDKKDMSYSKLMACLQPYQRNQLLKKLVDKAKINVTHIYLAKLLKRGYVDYVLTVNFDNLMLRALSLFNIFPPTYDMAIFNDLTTTTFNEKSVVYLHGQHHGVWLLNTKEEMDKVKATVPRIFDTIKSKRPWIFIGYSGSDPIFNYVKDLGRFDNGLYWVGYGDNPPAKNVIEFLKTPNTNAFYIRGYDADAFMLKLNESLDPYQPEILDKPFTCLQTMLNEVNDINNEDHFKGVKERLEMAKRDVDKAIRQFENKEMVPVDEEELKIEKLKKQIIDLLISEKYNEQQITSIAEQVRNINNPDTDNLMADLFNNWGNFLGDRAKAEKGKEAEDLYQQAFEKYRKAIEVKPDKDEAFYNWGTDLGSLAETKQGQEAEDLYRQAFEKFQKAIEIKPDKHQTFNNWGIYLGNLAQTKQGKEAEDLYQQAFEKYQKAVEIKPDKLEAFNNWGNSLGNLAETKEGAEAEDLYQQAFEKYQKAIEIKPDYQQAFNNWGTFLGKFAHTKQGKAAEDLYRQAFEKFRKAIEIKPDDHLAFYNWGNSLGNLANTKQGQEAEDLYRQAFEKYQKAVEIKPDDHQAFYSWGTYLGDLAKTKEGKEAEDLYRQAFEKFSKAIEYGGRHYNLACLYAIKGEKEKALHHLEISLKDKEITADYVLNDDDWQSLKEDEQFKILIKKYKV